MAALVLPAVAARPPPPSPGLTVLGVTLNRTPLAKIKRLLGKAEVQSNGVSGPLGASFLCYEGRDGTRLLFVSYGNGAGQVGGLQLLAKGERPLWDEDDEARGADLAGCLAIRKLSAATPLSGGLRLGASEAELRSRLGEPAKAPGEGPAAGVELHWFWDRSIRRGLEDYHRSSYVTASLREGAAVALRTGETSSN